MTAEAIRERREGMQAGRVPQGAGLGLSLSAQLSSNSDNIAAHTELLARMADTLDKIHALMESPK